MALQFTQITGSFEDGQGNALSGVATFTPNTTVYAAGVPVVEADVPIVAQIIAGALKNSSGGTLQLLATDNTGISYAGQTGFLMWTVSITLSGQVLPSWSFFLPHTPSPVDLFALANTAASGGFSNPMTAAGDLIDGGSGGAPQRLAIGSAGQVLTVSGGVPAWQAPGAALPLTTLGDTVYEDAAPAPARLPGNTSAAKNFLTQTGTGSVSAAPAWGTIAAGDLPAATSGAQGAVQLAGDLGNTAAAPQVTGTHLASPLPLAQGGTSGASQQAAINALTGTQAAGKVLRSDGTNAALANIQAGDVPTLNQSTTGTAAGLSATLAVGSGGTGQVTQQAAIDALAGAVTSGDYLRGNGTHVQMSAIQAADLPGATTGTQGAVILDGTAADIQPAGAAAAGAKGQAADAKHVHPYQPWQFQPESYGGKGDGKLVNDGAMTSGLATLACAASTPFTSTAADGGKAVIVMGAGAAGGPLLTTVSTVTDTGHAVLAAAASATVTGKGVIFGTDNTAAVKSAISAAVAYGQAGPQYAEVIFRPAVYVVAGAATVGGGTLGNAIFPLPVITASSAPKLTLAFKGLQSDAAALMHWLQPSPEASGAVLACLRLDGTVDATYGPASVIGGPYSGYGGVTSVFTNLQPVIDNLTVLVPFNSTFSGFDFYGCAEARVTSARVMPMAIVPSGGAWPQQDNGSITNAPQFGLRMPDVNNNDRCDVGYFSAEGMCYGFMPSEHTTADSVRAVNCIIGIQAYATSSAPHGAHIRYASVEACGQCTGVLSTGAGVKMQIDQLDVEGPFTNLLYDTSDLYTGEIRFRNAGTGYQSALTNATGFTARLINLDQVPGPVTSPQAPPASTAAWFNGYYRDAWITLHATTITAVSIDATAQNGLQSSPATYTFLLPSGHSYTPVYTGTLTHTVTLI